MRSTDLSQLGATDDADEEEDQDADEDADTPADGSDPVTEARNVRDQAIEAILLDTFDSPLYDEVFTEALTSTQAQIVRAAELEEAALLRDKGVIAFDMRRLYPAIYQRLAATEVTAEITQNEVPADYGIFPVADRETTINFFWTLIRNGPSLRTVTYAGAIMCLIGAVVVAERRPSTAIQFGGGMFGVALVVVVMVYIVRAIVPILAGSGSTAGPVVATYASNIWPLVRIMIRMMIIGGIVAFAGWIARLIWPDDWVYSHVSDERGLRSIQRRRGAREAEVQQQPVAAATPVAYPGYAQPYGYQPGWGQPYPGQVPYPGQPYPGQPYPGQGYPGQPYPSGYGYPVGPYAQPALPLPQQYTSPGNPTVPVMPVKLDDPDSSEGDNESGFRNPSGAKATVRADDLGDPDDVPSNAAQAVPRVVATTDAEEAADTSDLDADAPPGNETNGEARATRVQETASTSGKSADESDTEPDS